MKTIKLIALIILTTNIISAQTTYYGAGAGQHGINNAHYGADAGKITTGGNNVFLGHSAGGSNTSGSSNIYVGTQAGLTNKTGTGNVFIGRGAGVVSSGSRNILIGYAAAASLAGADDKLYIQNDNNITTPLIYGDFATDQLGIGTSNVPSDYTLAVNGKTITTEVQVMTENNWPDYVFAEDYNLIPLTDLEAEIEKLGHLPGVPSAQEVEENGHALGQMDAILLEKVEELTLHLIKINKEVEELKQSEKVLRQENVILKNNIKHRN